RSLGAMRCKIEQEGVAGAEGKEAQGDALHLTPVGENAVQNLVRGAVAADGEKAPISLIVGFARKLHGVPGTGRGNDVCVQAALAQADQRRAGQLSRAAAARGGVHDGEKSLHAREDLWPVPVALRSERNNGSSTIERSEPLRQDVSLDLQGSRAREVLVEEDNPVNSLVV